MPTSYSQTIESNDFLQEQSEQQQACAEGEVFNTDTQMCEPAATVEEEQQQEPVEEQACAEGEVFNPDTQMCEPAATVEEEQQVPPEELVPPEEIPSAEEKLVPAEELEAPARELVTKSEKELQALEGQQQAPVQEGQQTAGKVYKNFKSAKYPCEWDLNGDGVNDAKDDPKLFWDGKIPVKYDEKVVALQTYLTDLGFDRELEPEGIDGKFGPHTKNAVMAYQQDRGLIVDGIVGPNTWRLLCDDIYFLLKED